jgi:hypothetical protein
VDRYWEANAVSNAPPVPAAGSEGFPADGNPSAGINGTVPGAWWYHSVTEELRNAIAALGLTPDFRKTDQLSGALQTALTQVSVSINYDDLLNKPVFAKVATSGDYADLSNKPALAKVATSGSYNDLLDKPAIPPAPGYVTPAQFGAVCDGVTDDSAALLAALSSGKPVRHLSGTLAIRSVSVPATCDFEIASTASLLLLPTGDSSVGLTLNGPYSRIVAWGLIDGNNAGRGAVTLSASSNYSVAFLYNVQNVSGETFSGTHPSGIEIGGGTGQQFYINARNFPNHLAGQTGSPARAATVQGYADRVVGEVDADNVWVGVALATTTCHLKRVKVTNSGLEAVYNLNGDNTIGDVIYSGQYQAVVNEASVHIDRIYHTGGNPPTGAAAAANGGAVIALQNATMTDVGLIQVERNPALPVAGPGTLLIVRSGNNQSGPVNIGAVQGIMRPVALVSLGYQGAVQEVSIQNVNLSVEYDASVMTNQQLFCDLSVANGYTLRNWKVRVVDVNNAYTNSYFKVNLPASNLIRSSQVEDVRFYLYQQDGVTPAAAGSAYLRMYGAATPLVQTKGQIWEYSTGCIREANAWNALTEGGDVSTAVPTTGTWSQGKFLHAYAPVEAGAAGSRYVIDGWLCTVSGTPGTWVQHRVPTGN